MDTNARPSWYGPQPEPKVETWIAAQNLATLFISAVSFGEFLKGISSHRRGERREGGVCIWLLQLRLHHSVHRAYR